MATAHPLNHAYGKLVDPTSIRTYLFAGNSTFTLVSKATGRRFTYKVKSVAQDRNFQWSTNNQNRNFFFVSVLTGPDNTRDSYTYLGELIRQEPSGHCFAWRHGRKSAVSPDALSAKGFAWFVAKIESSSDIKDVLEFWHEGKCGRCGRTLTVPESIESGVGPECAGKV
jgi:hypothetical protein